MKKLFVLLVFVSLAFLAVSVWGEVAEAPAHNLAARADGQWVSPKRGGEDVTLGEEWIKYWSGTGYWIWWGGPERVTLFDPNDFPNAVYPFWIKRVRSNFYELGSRPWGACSLFTYKIYGDDGTTLLHESDTLVPTDRSGAIPTEWNMGADSLQLTYGVFYLSVAPVSDSHPSSYTDNAWQGHTWSGSPGAWSPFTYGELSGEAYVNWGSLAHDVSVMEIRRPGTAAWVDTSYLVTVRVRNNGSAAEDFDVECLIGTEYAETTLVSGLAGGGIFDVNFSNWVPAIYDNAYTVTARTLLATDQNPNNDELTKTTRTYEYGEIAYDDFEQDAWWVVNSPNGPTDVFAQKLSPYFGAPYYVTKFKIYVNSSQPFDNVRLCPDNIGVPNFSSPYQTISAPAASNPPEWIVMNFDTSLTRMSTNQPIWLCAQFVNGASGPGIGSDQDMPFNLRSYWTSDLASWNLFGEDWFMRVVHVSAVGVAEDANTRPGLVTRLYQNTPNPSSGPTTIRFSLSLPVHGTLRVYDASGSLVRTLLSGDLDSGMHSVVWDGKDEMNRAVGAGVYFYKLSAGGYNLTEKMVVMR
jgi:hypothetical protein